jgi:trimeric autotransporter adhesin
MMRWIVIVFVFSAKLYGQKDQWVSMPIEVNDRVNCLEVYQDRLIAGGFFTKAGGQRANRIAAWNGNVWDTLGSGVRGGYNPYINDVLEFNNELYVVGNFDSAGDVASKDVAKWDGSKWVAMGTGTNMGIYVVSVYKDEIYVGGSFDSIGGIAAKYVARWDGQNWHRVGEEFYGYNVNVLYE